MERKLKVYKVRYASGLFRNNNRQEQDIYSEKELKNDDFIVVEHVDCGVYIGQVLEDVSENVWGDCTDNEIKENIDYRYVQDIDLSDYLANIEKQKRKEELKEEMEKKFAEIDKEKKYQYYAELDSDFKDMYEEYKNL